MMTKLISKLRLFFVVSLLIIVLGMAVGTVCHFIAGGFYNYGGEYSSYKSVTVSYIWADVMGGKAEDGESASVDVEAICLEAFETEGVKHYTKTVQSTGTGEEITFRFTTSVDSEALQNAVKTINFEIVKQTAAYTEAPHSYAMFGDEQAIAGGEHVLARAAIALAVIVAIHLIYTVIRYKLCAMCAAFVADLHNIALFASLLALCRIPVTSSVLVFGVLVALVTVIGVTLTLDAIKRNLKDESNAKLSVEEITGLSANQTYKINIALAAFLVIAGALILALMAISTLSLVAVLSPALCAIVAFIVCCYGNVLFVPSVYPFIRNVCGKIAAKPSQKKGK